MIFIKQNTENNIVRRLFDKRKYCDSYFIFTIKNEQTKKEIKFLTEDLSDNTVSYNLFNLIHSIEGSKNGGIDVPLNLAAGQYEYTITETREYSFDEQYYVGQIEKDILVVEIERSVNTSFSKVNDIYY